jgi:hypothetical protein
MQNVWRNLYARSLFFCQIRNQFFLKRRFFEGSGQRTKIELVSSDEMTLLQCCLKMYKGFCSFPISQKINMSLGFALFVIALIILLIFFLRIMSGSVLVHCQRSLEDLQQLVAWYKIRGTLLGATCFERDIKKAIELASICEHPNAVWLTKLFGGRDVASREEARQVFLICEKDPRALCFAGLLGGTDDEIRQAADFGDAFAQAKMAGQTRDEERSRWAKKSAAQGERDGFYWLGHCYRGGIACEKDAERAKENFLVAAELGHVQAMVFLGRSLDKDDPQRFVLFGKAASSRYPYVFFNEMVDHMRNFGAGTGHAKVVFAIGRALNGHVNNEKRVIFEKGYNFDARIGRANLALHFYNLQLRSYRKAVDSWTIIGLRNGVVKDIRKMIGKMIWGAREEAAYLEEKQSVGDLQRTELV